MASGGTFYGTTSNANIRPKIVWSITQSVAGNYSKVTATLYYSRTDSGYTTYGTGDFHIVINGVDYGVSKYLEIGENSNSLAVSNTVTIAHNADGTKSITISASGSIDGTTLSSTSISATVTLDAIPRATTPVLSAASADMGASITISLTGAASSEFTHDLTYSHAGGAGTIATGIGKTTQPWTIPDFASSLPNANAGTVTITCVTKQGGTAIGTKTVLLTANIPADVVPVISNVAIAEATAGIAAQFGAYIQNKSALAVTITAAGAKGSTIGSYATIIQGNAYGGASITTDVLTASGTLPLLVSVMDSRGRTARLTTDVTVLAYTPPQISAFSGYRVDVAGDTDDSGDFVAVAYAYSVPALNGGNAAAMAIKYKRSIDAAYSDTLLTGTALTADQTDKPATEISSDYRWDLQITITDWFGAATTATVQLPSGEVILDIKADGTGVAVGKTAEFAGFEIAAGWAVRCFGKPLLEAIYPVGAVYLSASDTSPATLFGGTWVQIKDRFLLAAGDTYAAGATGGSASNTHHHYQTVGNDGSYVYATNGSQAPAYRTGSKPRGVMTPTAEATGNTREDATYDETISILPPYLAVYVWRRTA